MIDWNEIDWRRIRKIAVVAFLSLIIFYLLFDKIFMPAYTRHGQAITVPDLTNLIYEDAREVLNRLDLKIVEEAKKYDTSNQFPIGTIMVQNPAPNATVKKGRRIYVIVSKGEPIVQMPRLVGESERNAIFMLKNVGLALGQVHYEPSDNNNYSHIGKVIDQSVSVNREVKVGTSVDITVISESDFFGAPDIVGRSLVDARKILFQAGLEVGEIYYEEKPDLLPETVIDQFPRVDEKVSRGDSLRIWVSKLPDRN
jgi:beta-lactam-binding protein with PASTA domain